MGRPKHIVRLTAEERRALENLVTTGKANARKITHARILLKVDADGPNWSDEQVQEALDVGKSTVERVRRALVEKGLESSLNRKKLSRTTERKLDGDQEAHLIALTCSEAPEGRKRWTLRLLADKMVELEYVDTLSYETVRQVLKKTNLSLGFEKSGVFRRKRTANS
jgi:transposase